ncbi:hypothetical protein KF728_28155 [Candidatus Obscuribacterales bacterium]|nr:hypothetical protein [Candidatus Obscuribacterales bacterium]
MTILDMIVETKRQAFSPSQTPTLTRAAVSVQTKTSTENAFLFALSSNSKNINIIGEIKPCSPSAGKLLKDDQLDSILEVYKRQCAAISVLTDEKFFGGSFELLAYVKEKTGLPVLCKDFIVSDKQIALAKQHGADAVLLIAKVLSEPELISLFEETRRQNLIAVVEVNNESDVAKVNSIEAEIVLINNRNLDTMQIDLETTVRLAPMLKGDAVIISASGVTTRNDIRKLSKTTCNFLIGTSLMQSESLEKQLTEFKRETRVKICGITNAEDALMAVIAGADFIGLIFAQASQRRVKLEVARQVRTTIGNNAKVVGVFQNQDIEFVNRVAKELDLDYIQLHGEEDRNYIEYCNRPVIKTLSYNAEVETLRTLAGVSNLSYLLFDAPKESVKQEDVEENLIRFANRLRSIKESSIPSFFIAGKLTPDNVAFSIEMLKPFAVDVASGVESAPGVKSQELVRTFCVNSSTT